jgi:hypothetical protein
MDWATLTLLIINNGLPLALKLAEKWQSKDIVTPEEFAELKALAAQTPTSQMRDALTRAGIDILSPQAERLRALVGDKEFATPAAEPAPAAPQPS